MGFKAEDPVSETSSPTASAPPTPPTEASTADNHWSNRKASESVGEKTSPNTVAAAADTASLWSSRGAVPWPSNTYQILEKASGRAITITNDPNIPNSTSITLQPCAGLTDSRTHWLCVEKNGYFGFHSPKAGTYLGHDGKKGVRATATALEGWELLTPREHPEGGYQLLMPYWEHTLMVLCLAEDGTALARRNHGTTLWEFVRV